MRKIDTFYTRIQNKHDIETNWDKVTDFIPLAGEIIVYDADENYDYPRIKIGDGITLLKDLKFNEGSTSVLYTEQELTDEQKEQARVNINAYGFNWHSLGQHNGYVANAEDSDSITDWNTLLAVPSTISSTSGAFAILMASIKNLLNGYDKAVSKINSLSNFNTSINDLANAGISPKGYKLVYTSNIENTKKYIFFTISYNESKNIWSLIDKTGNMTTLFMAQNGEITIDSTLTYPDTTLSLDGRTADAKAVGDALALKVDKTEIVQSDWSVTDETDMAFIKNKPDIATDEDIATFISEMGIADPVTTSDGSVYTNANGDIYVL